MSYHLKPEDATVLAEMEIAIIRALAPFRARGVPALLGIMAFTRCCRKMLLGVPQPLRDELAQGCAWHVKGENPESSAIEMPNFLGPM